MGEPLPDGVEEHQPVLDALVDCEGACLRGERVVVHLLGIGEGGEADLDEVAPGQPILEQAAHRIAVHRPAIGVAHVEMGVEGDQADLAQRQAEAADGRAGHRIVAAEQDGERVRRGRAEHGVADRIESIRGRDAADGHLAQVADGEVELVTGLQIVGAEPPQRPPHDFRREIAAARRDRPLLHWRA